MTIWHTENAARIGQACPEMLADKALKRLHKRFIHAKSNTFYFLSANFHEIFKCRGNPFFLMPDH
jgi:hypothetical protein